MDPLDAIGTIGDVLASVCLLVGVPTFLLGRWLHARDRDLEPHEIVVIAGRGGSRVARWYAREDFHQRTLRASEVARLDGTETPMALVSASRPRRMRLERDDAPARTCTVVGIVLLVAAALGLAASVLPLLL